MIQPTLLEFEKILIPPDQKSPPAWQLPLTQSLRAILDCPLWQSMLDHAAYMFEYGWRLLTLLIFRLTPILTLPNPFAVPEAISRKSFLSPLGC